MSKQKKKKKKSFYEFEKGHTHICVRVCVLYLRFIKTIIGKTSQKKKTIIGKKNLYYKQKKNFDYA